MSLTRRGARSTSLVLAATLTFSGATVVIAKHRDDHQVTVSTAAPAAVNGSFVSPLVERFGRVQVGRGVFVAGNTVLRADPGGRVCLASETNVQDNVFVLALADRAAVRGTCARRATQTGRQTSLAHQAEVITRASGSSRSSGSTRECSTPSSRTAPSSCTGRWSVTSASRATGSSASASA
jgi:hypothetical protein